MFIGKGAPILLSMPHLTDAAPEYRTVRGLKPNLGRGITYVDIEPVSKIEIFMIITATH